MKNVLKKWAFRITKENVALLVIGILLNYVGRTLAIRLGWPIWADSLGSYLAALVLGPFGGCVAGGGTALLLGVTDPRALTYTPLCAVIGFSIGVSFPRGDRLNLYRVFMAAMSVAVFSAVLATAMSCIFYGGILGNVWGDALVEWIRTASSVPVIPTFLGALLVNFPDKLISIIFAMSVIGVSMKVKNQKEFPKHFGDMFLLFVVILTLVAPVMTVNAEPAVKKNLTTEYASMIFGSGGGLHAPEMNAVAQTPDGYIWVGGYSGLYRFDGTKFSQVDLGNGISSITTLFVDSKGYLWIGTNDMGAVRYDVDNDKVYIYGVNRGMPAESVRSINEGPDDNIFVGTVSYSAVIRPYGMVGTYNQLEDLKYINNFCIDDDGNCACVSQNGYVLLIADQMINYVKTCDIDNAYYVSATWGKGGDLWLGTSTNVIEHYRLSAGKLTPRGILHTDNLMYLNDIMYSTYFGGIFVCAENGFGFVDAEEHCWDLTMSGFDNAISDVLVDYQGNVWFTSQQQGVLKLSPNIFTHETRSAEIDEMVNCLYRDGRELYMGTEAGIRILDLYTNQEVHHDWQDYFQDTRIRHIMKDSDECLWICTYGNYGITQVKPNGEMITYKGSKADDDAERFHMTIELRDGTIVAAGMSGVYFIRDGEIFSRFTEADGLKIPRILCLLETEDDKLLACSDGDGVYVFREGELIEHIDKREGLNSLSVLRAIHCGYGYIYVTSNALFYDDRSRIHRLTNFPYSNNYDAFVTEDNELWVSSSAGIYIADVNDVLSNEVGYPYTLLDQNRGLNTNLTADSWNIWEGDEMFFCCTDGVRSLDRGTYNEAIADYTLCVDEIRVNDEIIRVGDDGVYDIPAGPGKIMIRPGVLNYSMTNPLVHYYIEGVEASAITARQNELTDMTLTKLEHGDYELHIQILDEYTNLPEREQVFYIKKEPKLYEKLYYRIYVLIVSFMMVGFSVWIIAQMRSLSTIEQQYEEIRVAKDEAEMANKAKSNFLASMSHEIRTPINAVLGMDEMILRESRDNSVLEYASDIYSAGQTLLSLINQILDSSKIESGKMEIVPVEYELGTMIHNLHNLIIQRASEADLSLVVEVDNQLPQKLRGDDVRIRQVITNMLSNAVKYTDEGTVWLRVSGTVEGDVAHLHVEVEDTGMGIKEEEIPHLFDAFKRLDLSKNHYVEGTGLGLNISLQLLQLMGSDLKVESEYGKGSKFYFDIDQDVVDATPLGEDFDPANTRVISMEPSTGGFIAPKARILVVDDNSMNRRVFKSLVKEMQLQVEEASCGADAIELAKKEHFDLIFMDHMMPEMDGVEAMQQIRSLRDIPCEHTPIYVLTANAITGAKEAYLDSGFDGFIAKPIVFEKLEEALREALPPELLEAAPEGTTRGADAQGPEVPEDLPSVEGLDWSFAWLHLPGVDLLEESLKEFHTLIPVQSHKLDVLYDELMEAGEHPEALENYRILVHAMKGLAATVGIIPLAGPAKMLEFAARDNRVDIIKTLHPIFIAEWNSYTWKLRGVFGIGEESHVPKHPGNRDILQRLADVINDALYKMNIDRADKAVQKLQEFSFGEEVDALVPTLVGAVTDLDENLAAKTLQQMLQNMQS